MEQRVGKPPPAQSPVREAAAAGGGGGGGAGGEEEAEAIAEVAAVLALFRRCAFNEAVARLKRCATAAAASAAAPAQRASLYSPSSFFSAIAPKPAPLHSSAAADVGSPPPDAASAPARHRSAYFTSLLARIASPLLLIARGEALHYALQIVHEMEQMRKMYFQAWNELSEVAGEVADIHPSLAALLHQLCPLCRLRLDICSLYLTLRERNVSSFAPAQQDKSPRSSSPAADDPVAPLQWAGRHRRHISVLSTFLRQLRSDSFLPHPALADIKQSFQLEVTLLKLVLCASDDLTRCHFYSTVSHIYRALSVMNTWRRPYEQSTQLRSSRDATIALISWYRRMLSTLAAVAGLYFSKTLSARCISGGEDFRSLYAQSSRDLCASIETFLNTPGGGTLFAIVLNLSRCSKYGAKLEYKSPGEGDGEDVPSGMRSWPILYSYPQMPTLPMDHWPNVVSLLMSRRPADDGPGAEAAADGDGRRVEGFFDKRAKHSYLTEPLDAVGFVYSLAIFRSTRSLSQEKPLLARFTHLGALIRRDHAFMPFPENVDPRRPDGPALPRASLSPR